MTWALVYISIVAGVAQAQIVSQHPDIIGCFFAREVLLLEHGGGDTHFPANTQALCINTKNK